MAWQRAAAHRINGMRIEHNESISNVHICMHTGYTCERMFSLSFSLLSTDCFGSSVESLRLELSSRVGPVNVLRPVVIQVTRLMSPITPSAADV